MPTIRWPAVLAGVALAAVITIAAVALLPPIPAAVAPVFGLIISGFLAGIRAPAARAYHGALVGAGYVVCEAIGLVPSATYLAEPLTETIALIVSDALLIGVAALGGWSARLWSSSDRDRDR